MNKQAEKDPKMEMERDPEMLEGFAEQPKLVRDWTVERAEKIWGNPIDRAGSAHLLMERLGITDKIPEEEFRTSGYQTLSKIKKKMNRKDKKGAKIVSIALGSGEKGLPEESAKILESYGIPVINYRYGKSKRKNRTGEDIELREAELFEQQEAMNIANKTLRHILSKIN